VPTVALKTLGCKLNQGETDQLRARLAREGFDAVPFGADADYYVVNTCSVTGASDYKSRQLVRRLCRTRPAARVFVTGCYAELRPDVFAALGPGVEVVPNRAKEDLPRRLAASAPPRDERRVVAAAPGRTRFFLKIQDGCDHACAYCVVPRARGRSRSRAAADVVADAGAALAAGIKEIVLVGVDLGAYGRDRDERVALADLVERLAALPGDFRLRLSSVDAADLTPALVDALAASPRLCPHVHLPLQSGADAVLRGMRRRYRADDYRRACEGLLAAVPDVALGADVIAGLPGEDEAAFDATARLLDEFPFAYVHVFPFSPRPGTAAATATGQVGSATRDRRAATLRALARKKRAAFEAAQVGAVRTALVEAGGISGRGRALTDNYIHIRLVGYAGPANRFVRVRLAAAPDGGGLTGTPV